MPGRRLPPCILLAKCKGENSYNKILDYKLHR